MVADDEVYAAVSRIFHLLYGLDAAVEADYQAAFLLHGPVDTLVGHAVALVVTVGNVVFQIVGHLAEECVHQGDCGGAVHVIVSVDEDLLLRLDCLVYPFHGFVHIEHQERVVEHREVGTEEFHRVFIGRDAALDKQVGQNLVNAKLLCELTHKGRVAGLFHNPLFLSYRGHNGCFAYNVTIRKYIHYFFQKKGLFLPKLYK